jgi:hypothetical protein
MYNKHFLESSYTLISCSVQGLKKVNETSRPTLLFFASPSHPFLPLFPSLPFHPHPSLLPLLHLPLLPIFEGSGGITRENVWNMQMHVNKI